MSAETSAFELIPRLTPETRKVLLDNNFFMLAGALALRQEDESEGSLAQRIGRSVGDIEEYDAIMARHPERVVFRDPDIPTWVTIWARSKSMSSELEISDATTAENLQ